MPKSNGNGAATEAAKQLRKAHESNGEEYFAGLLRSSGRDLPTPEREHQFDPTRKWAIDFAYPESRVGIEIDGGNHMARIVMGKNGRPRAVAIGRHTKDNDLDKCNEATARGWRILHFTPAMLMADGEHCLAQVRCLVCHIASADPLGVRVPVIDRPMEKRG